MTWVYSTLIFIGVILAIFGVFKLIFHIGLKFDLEADELLIYTFLIIVGIVICGAFIYGIHETIFVK